MKKLFLLLILSFFSIQGYAGSCPDGSEPVKSISDDGTYFVYNCGGQSSSTANSNSTGSTIGQSIYKTITRGDAEVYQAQMLLNRFTYYVGKPNGKWTWETQSAVQKFYRESGRSFNGKWSSQVLSDLMDRRLITMPRSGPLSYAEKDEMLNVIRLKHDDVSELEKPWYRLNQVKFAVVTSDEKSPPFCYPTPQDCNDWSGIYTPEPANAAAGDFNGDGLQDLAIVWEYMIHTTPRSETPSHVRFYLNDGNSNLVSSPEIYALNELPFRHKLYRMTVNDFNSDGRDDLFVGSMGVIMRIKNQGSINDFEPNLLLLSTENGQMEDASHLIEGQENGGMIQNYRFSHATASGDVNCDGHADIYTGNVLLMGDGTGRFTNNSRDLPTGIYSHQKANSFASTIADFNGDGCGDIAMHLQNETVRVWMSHYGKHHSRSFNKLKMTDYYGEGNTKANDMASGDLDGDGDPDLVVAITRANPYYIGRKLLVFINQNGELVETTMSSIKDERDQDIDGKLQNWGEGIIQLVDHDRDGDLDIIDSTAGSFEKNGRFGYAIFENDGTGRFNEIPESEFVILKESSFKGYKHNLPQVTYGYPIDIDGIGRLDYVSFMRSPFNSVINNLYSYGTVFGYTVLGRDKPITKSELEKREEWHHKKEEELRKRDGELKKRDAKVKEERKEELRKNPVKSVTVIGHSKKFNEAMAKLNKVSFEGKDTFTPFHYPIPLGTSGALIIGYKDLKHGLKTPGGSDGPWVKTRVHLKYGDHNISTNMLIQYFPSRAFMGASLSFMFGDWGGTKDIYQFGVDGTFFVGNGQIESKRDAMAKLGIDAVLDDLQAQVWAILETLEARSYTSLDFLTSR